VEQLWSPPLWLQALVWPLLALAMLAVLLPVAKGGVLGAMWALGLGERVRWHGSLPHDRVIRHFEGADLFALASRICADGDRDGLPNVLMEAQLLGAACVATRVSGTPELIEHEVNGLLVPPRDTAALAAALGRAIAAPELRRRLAAAGRRVVTTRFSFEDGVARIAARLTAPSGSPPKSSAERARGIRGSVSWGPPSDPEPGRTRFSRGVEIARK